MISQSTLHHTITALLITTPLVIIPLTLGDTAIFEYERIRIILFFLIVGSMIINLGVHLIYQSSWHTIPKKIVILSIVFTGIYLISSVFGTSPKDSIIGRYGIWIYSFTSLLLYITYTVITIQYAGTHRKKLLDFSITFLVAVSIILLYQSINQTILSDSTPQWYSSLRATATFRNPNQLGNYAVIMGSFALGLIAYSKIKDKTYATIIAVCSILIIILTQSRGSWIVTVVVIVIAAILRNQHQKPSIKPIYLLLGTIIVILSSPIIINRVQGTLKPQTTRSSQNIRMQEWATGLKIVKDNFWLGIGPENVDLTFPQYRSIESNQYQEEWQWRTVTIRNFFIELVVTTGILGLTAYLIFMSYIAYLLYCHRQYHYLLPFVAFHIHNLIYNPSLATILLWLFITALGISAIIPTEKNIHLQSKKIGASAAIITVGSILLFITIQLIRSEHHAHQGIMHLEKNPNQAVEHSLLAYQINPWFDKNLRQLILTIQESLRKDTVINRQTTLQDYYDYLNLLTTHSNHDIENLKTLSSGYMRYAGFTGTPYHQAIKWGTQLISSDPTGPGSWDTLGMVYLDAKQFTLADQTFNHIVTHLKPDYPYAYFHYGESLKQQGKINESKIQYQKALELGYAGAKVEIDNLDKSIVDTQQ